MFLHLDVNSSGAIEVKEIEQAMRQLTALNPLCPFERHKVLETFESSDGNGTGCIDWDDFVQVMTSDARSHAYPLLSDEQKANNSQQQVFYEFATLYRRQMLINDIKAKADTSQVGEACDIFRELFEMQLTSDKLAEDAQTKTNSRIQGKLRVRALLDSIDAAREAKYNGVVVPHPRDTRPGAGDDL
ncbi:hypothetical protein CTAYLR_001877 [Chrysophaeum taylorii]|uniref:EF-hand domain-containing protein n=1 Tax=Chrysophaeum taylorii TaxID=2483200 RepID=A0AAD7UAH4_9STRA|nr:hypothetical protein CTAYLR_001877 [Chrysophaeum taylorii]